MARHTTTKRKGTGKKQEPRLRLYADENVAPAFVLALRHFQKVNIVSAVELGFRGRDDGFHFAEAKRERRFLLTNDHDFLDDRRFPLQSCLGVIVLAPPKEHLDVGYYSLWLTEHLIPSLETLLHTKVVVHRNKLVIHGMRSTGERVRQTLPLPAASCAN